MRAKTIDISAEEWDRGSRDAVTGAVWELLRQLGQIEDGGLRLTISTTPKVLEQSETVSVTALEDARTYVCVCGFEAGSTEELVTHLRRHGATRLVVTPENWKPR